MILSGKDKLYHITACALITIVTFVALLVARRFQDRNRQGSSVGEGASGVLETASDVEAPCSRDMGNNNAGECSFSVSKKNWVLVGLSSLVALSIGITKEIGDLYNFWWLCQSKNEDGSIVGCNASWGDLLADLIGIILAQAIILSCASFDRGISRSALNYYPMAITTSTDS